MVRRSEFAKILITTVAVTFAAGTGLTSMGEDTTQYGGMVLGSESSLTNTLGSLAGRPGIGWIRGRSPHAIDHGFQWLGDVRYYVGGLTEASHRLPENLLDVYWACRTNLPSAPQAPQAWEVWNEPDFYFLENNAADMAATLKAAWWGIKTAHHDTPVLMPALAFRPSRYALELAHNGLASWTDGLNFHFYGWPADYKGVLEQHRTFARAIGLAGPTWVSEIGYFQMPLASAGDPEALARQAAFHERVMIESWAARVDRHLVFSLSPFFQSGLDLGLTDSAGQWRPALKSVVELAARLPGSQARWRLVHEPSGEGIGVVLEQSDGSWWSVLWSPERPGGFSAPALRAQASPPERLRLAVKWPPQTRSIQLGLQQEVSLDAAQLPLVELTSERNLFLRTPPVRYQLAHCTWIPITAGAARGTRTKATREARLELDQVPKRRDPSPVVLRFLPEGPLRAEKASQTLRLAPGESAGIAIQLHNFSEQPLRGAWEIEVPPGWEMASTSGHVVEAGPPGHEQQAGFVGRQHGPAVTRGTVCQRGSPVSIPPLSRIEAPFRIQCAAGAASTPSRLRARWNGEDGSVDEVAVRVAPDLPLPAPWHRFSWREFLPRSSQPAAWQVFEVGTHEFALEIKEPWGTQQDAVVFLRVPPSIRSNDAFVGTLRLTAGRGPIYAQLFLGAGEDEVWRYGEWEVIPREGLKFRATLGDFTPTIWSRARSFLFPPVREAHWMALRFQGLRAGDVIGVETPALCRF